MIRIEVAQRSENKKELFQSRFKAAVSFLEQNQINYRILGGLACEAILAKSNFNPCHQDGSLRDIDLILADETPQKVSKDLTNLCSPIIICQCFKQHLHFNKENGGYISFWQNKISLDKEILEPYRVSLIGVEFDTLSPQFLFHLPALHNKADKNHLLRKKDFKNMVELGRLIRGKEGLAVLFDAKYQPFHDCLKKSLNKKLPYSYINRIIEVYYKLPQSLRLKIPRLFKDVTKDKVYKIGGALGKRMEKTNMLK